VSALIDGNEAYQVVKIIHVDWDLHRSDQFTKDLKIRRQSTMVLFKDGAELDRVVAQTSAIAIEHLLEQGISS